MPLAKSQVLILSDLHHSREPVIERLQCHKLDANLKTIAISPSSPSFKSSSSSSSSNQVSTLKTKISQKTTVKTKISPLSPADDQLKLNITNPWGPMFKDYEAFIDAHVF